MYVASRASFIKLCLSAGLFEVLGLRGVSARGKTCFLIVLLVVAVLLTIVSVGADMPEPQVVTYKVEIQGAHKVSEGGNLWFYMINHDNQSFNVTVEFDGGVRSFNRSIPGDYLPFELNPFMLPVNASANIFFQALNVSGKKVSNEFLFFITPSFHPVENASYHVHTDKVDFFTTIEPLQDQSPFPILAFQITAVLLVASWIALVYLGLRWRKRASRED
jgi:hypothetical protein